MSARIELINAYLNALNQMTLGEELAKFFHPDVKQTEFPNKITPKRVDRDLNAILDGAARGAQIMQKQHFAINNIFDADQYTVAELTWTGTLSVPIGSLNIGEEMIAHFACIFEFKDGLIFRQRNYDCFEDF